MTSRDPDPGGNRTRGGDDPSAVEHDRYLDLASAAVDGEITGEEQAVLDRHLDECPECRRFMADADRLRRRCRVRAVDSPDVVDPGPIVAALRRHGRRDGRQLARRSGVAGAIAAALVAVVGIAVSAGSPAPDPAEPVAVTRTVHTGDRSFDHDQVALPVGATVAWSNSATHAHLLVQQAGTTTVRTSLAPGDHEDVTFDEAGVYDVSCAIHPEMSATVTVAS